MCLLGRRLYTSEAIYKLLIRLGSDTIEKFHVSRLLRSTQTDVKYLFLLCRLSHHLGEPFRTRSQSQLRLILQFKGTGPPPPNVPMRLQILSDSMDEQIKRWLLGFAFHHAVIFSSISQSTCTLCPYSQSYIGATIFHVSVYLDMVDSRL